MIFHGIVHYDFISFSKQTHVRIIEDTKNTEFKAGEFLKHNKFSDDKFLILKIHELSHTWKRP